MKHVIILAAFALAGIGALPQTAPAQSTTFTKTVPVLFALHIEGSSPIQVFKVEGGEPVSSALFAYPSPELPQLPNKQHGPVQYRDLVFDYLPIPGTLLNTVIADAISAASRPLSGSIVMMDGGSRELSRVHFSNARVRHVEFSEMDLTLNQSPMIRITLAVPGTSVSAGSNQPVPYGAAGKGAIKSAFRLLVQGLETASQKAVRVEPQKFISAVISPGVLGKFDYGNLVVVLPESDAAPFALWHQAVLSQPASQPEKPGELQWLSPDRTKPLVSLQLQNLGVLSVIRIPNKPGYVAVEMYCEKVVPQVF